MYSHKLTTWLSALYFFTGTYFSKKLYVPINKSTPHSAIHWDLSINGIKIRFAPRMQKKKNAGAKWNGSDPWRAKEGQEQGGASLVWD